MGHNINVTQVKIDHNLINQSPLKANNIEKTAEDVLNSNFDNTQTEENQSLKNERLTDTKNHYLEKIKSEHKESLKDEPSEDEINNALGIVSNFMAATLKNIDFSNDSSSGKTVIKVFDKETKELISQFPSDKIISMAEKIKSLHQEIESTSGLLVDNHV